MDDQRFDALTKAVATAIPRRRILRTLCAALVAGTRSVTLPPFSRDIGAVVRAESDPPTERFVAPFSGCDHRKVPASASEEVGDIDVAKQLKILDEGFAGLTSKQCDARSGAVSFSAVAYGGVDGHLGIGGSTEPTASVSATEAITIEFTPAFSGQLRVGSTVAVKGSVSAAAGSGFAADIIPDSITDVLGLLLPAKYAALLELAKASLQPTHADVDIATVLDVSGANPVYGGGPASCETRLVAAAASFTGVIPVFPAQMEERVSRKAARCSVTVNVEQGKPLRIVAGLSSRARAWGLATAVARVDDAKVSEVTIENLSTSAVPQHVTPGGLWVIPDKGTEMVGEAIPLAAFAYPTVPSDPPVERVEFTTWWPERGSKGDPWEVVCVVDTPVVDDLYACEAAFAELGVPPGEVWISFDVYDEAGNRNLAPHGERTISWSPGIVPQATSLPDFFIGRWEGEGTQTDPLLVWPITIALTGGSVGEVVGTVEYPTLGCSGELTLQRADPDDPSLTVEVAEDITEGESNCIDGGTFVLTEVDGGFLQFHWTSPQDNSIADGILSRVVDVSTGVCGGGSSGECGPYVGVEGFRNYCMCSTTVEGEGICIFTFGTNQLCKHHGPCGSSSDCGPGEVCVDFCGPPLCYLTCDAAEAGVSVGNCPEGFIDCDGSCVDPMNDPANCGACGIVCESGWRECLDGFCTAPISGMCGHEGDACPEPRDCCQGLTCVGGICGIGGTCSGENGPCASDGDCCPGNICIPCVFIQCEVPGNCHPTCSSDADCGGLTCCSYNGRGFCRQGCAPA